MMTLGETERPNPYPGIREAKISLPKRAKADHGVSIVAQISTIRRGVLSKAFVQTAKRIGLPQAELARKLGLSPRTIAARLAARRSRLNAEESEKIIRIQQIFEQAVRVFGSQEEAREWLRSPAHGLEGQRPIDLLDTEPGSAQVRDYLGAIEYGNYW
jgi:putative toxin-antitoxin system antitoxin component (TIGR02293 family)